MEKLKNFFESLIETLEIKRDRELMKQLRQSIREMESGKLIPWEEVRWKN